MSVLVFIGLLCIVLHCNGRSIREQRQHIDRRFYDFPKSSVILGAPSYPSHLPEAEPILPGHTLVRPALGMLKSSIKFPHRELENGFGVYGNVDSLGITLDRNERVPYSGFRRFSNLVMVVPRSKAPKYSSFHSDSESQEHDQNVFFMKSQSDAANQNALLEEKPNLVVLIGKSNGFKDIKSKKKKTHLEDALSGFLGNLAPYDPRPTYLEQFKLQENPNNYFSQIYKKLRAIRRQDTIKSNKTINPNAYRKDVVFVKPDKKKGKNTGNKNISHNFKERVMSANMYVEKTPENITNQREAEALVLDETTEEIAHPNTEEVESKKYDDNNLNNFNTKYITQEISEETSELSGELETIEGSTEKAAKYEWFWNSKDQFDHIKINPSAPVFYDFMPKQAEDSIQDVRNWWFYNQADHTNLEED